MDDKTIESEIFKAIGYLFIALIAYVVYQMGKKGLGRDDLQLERDTPTGANKALSRARYYSANCFSGGIYVPRYVVGLLGRRPFIRRLHNNCRA